MSKNTHDDGFHADMIQNANLVGALGIPQLMPIHAEIPLKLIPFEKCKSQANFHQFVHFYTFDCYFASFLKNIKRYLPLLKKFDGVITPDCSLPINQSPCLLHANTYINRAVGYYLQENHIPIIPNVRWGDESTFSYCFQGIPSNSIVSISTHGCIKSNWQKQLFKKGLETMISALSPTDIIVHGRMPDSIFSDYKSAASFHQYPSQIELTHRTEET